VTDVTIEFDNEISERAAIWARKFLASSREIQILAQESGERCRFAGVSFADKIVKREEMIEVAISVAVAAMFLTATLTFKKKKGETAVAAIDRIIGSAGATSPTPMLTFARYASEARKTAIYPKVATIRHATSDDGQDASTAPVIGEPTGLVYACLGLAGEAGEVAEHAKKMLRDDDGRLSDERRAKLRAELGDVLWYVAAIADELGENLDAIASENLSKLARRAEQGKLGGSGSDR
jgi:MazG nucleotide pyrophosphohydrolase domain.